jgi:hypothetical protein
MFEVRVQALDQELTDLSRSPVMDVLDCGRVGDEWRVVLGFRTQTFVKLPSGEVTLVGPVVIGVRYHARFLSEVPHPFEVATVLEPPQGVWHPNINPITGAICLGHVQVGVTLESIAHQLWAGINLNWKVLGLQPGNVVNRDAAAWLLANAKRAPISIKGLFEKP